MIEATVGRLGKGKTLTGVIKAYDAYMEGKTVFSNIWLDFPHEKIAEPYDFLKLEDGFFLADELWHLADNRKSFRLLNDVMTVLLIRSRKRNFDVFYTQQFLQIDCRIAYITDKWIKPHTIPPHEECKRLKIPPYWLELEVYDEEFRPQPPQQVRCGEYLSLYDTEKDPYTLAGFVTDIHLKGVLKKALQDEDIRKKVQELSKLEEEALARIKRGVTID